MRLSWWFSGKESASQCRRCQFDPWVGAVGAVGRGRSPGKGNANPLQCSYLGNLMDKGA